MICDSTSVRTDIARLVSLHFKNGLYGRWTIKRMNQNPQSKSSVAVLLIAHGSRRPEANHDLVQLAELLIARRDYEIVEVSYLELTTPTILDGGRACAARGASKVLMLPYFLSAGVHVVTDLKEFQKQLAEEFPQIEFILCPHLGLHPLMADIVVARVQEGSPVSAT